VRREARAGVALPRIKGPEWLRRAIALAIRAGGGYGGKELIALTMTRTLRRLGAYWGIPLGLAALAALALTALSSYLLFHSLAEMMTVAVAACAFIIAWNGQRLYANSYLFVVGVGLGFVAFFALLHALAYKGMGVFPGDSANLATQLWLASRGLLGLTLVAAPLFLGRRLHPAAVLLTYGAATALLVCAIFAWHIFPPAFVDRPGGGLTTFKIAAEYIISLAMVVGLVLLWRRRGHFDRRVLHALTAAVALTIASELAFTQYVSVYGGANLVGHLLMVLSFSFFYVAIVRTALADPLRVLFRELKQHEEELEAARETQEQVTQFLVHDLRSPLTTVTSVISVLRSARERGDRGPAQDELLDAAEASVGWLLTLITALLDASRLQSGVMPLTLRAVSIAEITGPALEQVSLWAELGGMEVRAEAPGRRRQVVADPEVTVRVLVNLLSNAIKYSPPGSVITLRASSDQPGAVTFSVADQGPGIAAEWVGRMFERFAVGPRAAGVPASGLGLHFCKLAVEAQGGRVWLASKVGKGTVVSFTLPAGEAAEAGGHQPGARDGQAAVATDGRQ
jgi:signal transduction histidine kinase